MKMKMTKQENYPMKHDNGKTDERYFIHEGLNEAGERGYTVRFCQAFIGFSLTYTYACVLCHDHHNKVLNVNLI